MRPRLTKLTMLLTSAFAVGATSLFAASTPAAGAEASALGGTESASSYHCPYKDMCLHLYSTRTHTYSWHAYYSCAVYEIDPQYEVTWWINNQTPGTHGLIIYKDEFAYDVGAAYSSGRPPRDNYIRVMPCP
jgi:hypothetical protein